MATTFVDRLVSRFTLPPSGSLTVSFRDAAKMTGLSERTLRRLAASERLGTARVGTRVLIKMESLRSLVG